MKIQNKTKVLEIKTTHCYCGNMHTASPSGKQPTIIQYSALQTTFCLRLIKKIK